MILLVRNIEELQSLIQKNKDKNRSVGFVPTMGALHRGHITLARKAVKENKFTIVSIFVNPTQFNDPKDLERYPQTLDDDLLKLMPTKVDVVIFPPVSEIYPTGLAPKTSLDLGGLDQVMEGAFRPGHFEGVAQVVKRLLDIVQPDKLYMGQKDFQQFTIIGHLIKTLDIPTKLVVCPIIREPNGLAMSSRNERLSPEVRKKAGIIYRILKTIKKGFELNTIEELEQFAIKKLAKPPFEPEYFSIVDGYTLLPVSDKSSADYIVACTAVWVEGVRIIDNIILKGASN